MRATGPAFPRDESGAHGSVGRYGRGELTVRGERSSAGAVGARAEVLVLELGEASERVALGQ